MFLGLHRGYGDTFVAQLDGAMESLGVTLSQCGFGLEDLAKVSVWLCNIRDLPVMEERFTAYFPGGRFPARMTATTEFIDSDCLVMLDGIAHRG